MKVAMAAARALGERWHKTLAAFPLLGKAYFSLLTGLLRPFPFPAVKIRVLNSLNRVDWGALELGPRTCRVGATSIRLVPHPGEFDCEAVLFRTLSYESAISSFLEQTLPGYDAFLEIGANVGLYSILAGKLFERAGANGPIVVFEPSRRAFGRLLRNLEANRLRNVLAFNAAVGDGWAVAQFFEPEGHLTNGSLDEAFASRFSDRVTRADVCVVPVTAVEPLLTEARRILVKIDAEGWEPRILPGLEGLARRKQVDFLIEVLPGSERALDEVDFIATLGYRRFHLSKDGPAQEDHLRATEDRDWFLARQAVSQ